MLAEFMGLRVRSLGNYPSPVGGLPISCWILHCLQPVLILCICISRLAHSVNVQNQQAILPDGSVLVPE